MLVIFILAVVLPLATCFWILTTWILTNDGESLESESPTRWLVSLLLPLVITCTGIRNKDMDLSGALSSFFVGFILTFSNYCFLASLLTFHTTYKRAKGFRSAQKRKLYRSSADDILTSTQVLCSCGMATEVAMIYLVDKGCGEHIVDFSSNYRGSWMAVCLLASLACASGDVWASEIGGVLFCTGRPFLITTWKRVPNGTHGAISLIGIVLSAVGGFFIGLAYYSCLLFSLGKSILYESPPQWPIVIIATMAGVAGSLINSLLGATLRYSGFDEERKLMVDRPGASVRHISGLAVLDGMSINLLASVVTGLCAPRFAMLLWEFV